MTRRLTRQDGSRKRVWTAELDGTAVRFTTGVVGGRLRTRVQRFPSITEAAVAVADAAQILLTAGWVPDHEGVSAGPVDAVPAGAEALAIHADHLTEGGDPRGALILVQRALEDRPDDEPLLAEQERLFHLHGPAWVGTPHPDVELTWRAGYVEALRLPRTVDGAAELVGLIATGSLAGLRRLMVLTDAAEGVVEVLAGTDWPHLREVEVVGDGAVRRPLAELIARLPVLRRLVIQVDEVDWTGLVAPRLMGLDMRVHRLDAEALAGVDLPVLRTMGVDIQGDGALDRAALQRAVDRSLTELRLGGAAPVEWLAGLTQRPTADRVVLCQPLQPREVEFWLEERRSLLMGCPLELDFEIADATLQRLARVDLTVPLPDAAAPRRSDERSTRQLGWRRFEKDQRSGRGFWSIVREGADVVVRHGRVGRDGREQRTEKRSEKAAAAEYERRVRRKVAGGWSETT